MWRYWRWNNRSGWFCDVIQLWYCVLKNGRSSNAVIWSLMEKYDSRTFHHCWSMLWEEMLVRFILPCCTGLAICLGQWVPDLSLIVNLILVLIKFHSKPVTCTVAMVFNIWSCIILRNMERTWKTIQDDFRSNWDETHKLTILVAMIKMSQCQMILVKVSHIWNKTSQGNLYLLSILLKGWRSSKLCLFSLT